MTQRAGPASTEPIKSPKPPLASTPRPTSCSRRFAHLGAAREKVRVANALGSLPRIDDALRAGEISYSIERRSM